MPASLPAGTIPTVFLQVPNIRLITRSKICMRSIHCSHCKNVSFFTSKLFLAEAVLLPKRAFFDLPLFCNCSRRSEQQATGLRVASVGAKRVPLGLSTPRTSYALAASQLLSDAGGHHARLKRKKQPLVGKPTVAVSFLLGCSGFSRTGSERSRDLPCYQRCTTGIQYLHLLLPHHLLPWSEGRLLLHPLLQEPE